MMGTIDGTWRNQLGSLLEIEADSAGALTGSFRAAVGDMSGRHPVRGWFQQGPGTAAGPIGLVVSWPAEGSVTVWSGRYRPADDEIDATWLLSGRSAGPADWCSTLVGHDVFRRVDGEEGDLR